MLLYNSYIVPHYLYCNLIWGNVKQNVGALEELLIFQKKLARIILFAPYRLGQKVHAAPLMHQLKMLDIFEMCKIQQVCLAHTIINGKAPTVDIALMYVGAITYTLSTKKSLTKTLHVTRTNTSIGDRGIQHSIQHAWNNLTLKQRDLDTVPFYVFKKKITDDIFENHTDIDIIM
jgi:hypothetical protein